MIPQIAVVGSGYWGKNLVRNFHALGSLALICDQNESVLAGFRQAMPEVETTLALSDVLGRKDISSVAVATPAETHFHLVQEALLAGKHVFVEKPLALTKEQAQMLVDLAREKKLVLMVGHLLQYHPIFLHLKALEASGALGRINYIYSHRLNLGKIRREENILWSFAPHDISMILGLAGEEPDSVMALGGNYLHQKIADVTTTHMDFPSGLKAHIFVSWLHPFKEQKLVVVGDKKMAVFDDTKPWSEKLLLYPHEIRWENNVPVPAKAEPEKVDVPQSEPLRDECSHFLECIEKGATPRTDGEEGLRVLKVLNAAQKSLDNHGIRVSLDEDLRSRPRESDTSKPLTSVQPADPFIHSTAVVDQETTIGKGTKVWHFSHVLSGSTIGKGCNIGQNVVIGPDATLGNGCKVQNNVSVYKGVTLEDDVFCGPSMVFTNVFNPRAAIRRMDEVRTTLIKNGASLGANCTIVCGHTVGRFAFVGAGAVVTKDVPDHALVFGNPAKQHGWMCECGNKLNSKLKCPECHLTYTKTATGLKIKPSQR